MHVGCFCFKPMGVGGSRLPKAIPEFVSFCRAGVTSFFLLSYSITLVLMLRWMISIYAQ